MTPQCPDNERGSRLVLLLTGLGWALLPWLQWMPVDFERGALLLAFGPALLAGRCFAGREWTRWWGTPSLRALLLGGLAILGCATASAAQPAPALVQAAQIILLGLIALLAGGLRSEVPGAARWLTGGLMLGALSGVAALLVSWMVHASPHHTRPDLLLGFYPHPRHIGLHLLPAAALAPMLAAMAVTRAGRLTWLAVATVLMTALVWSGGRMPLVALTAAAISGCWFARGQIHWRHIVPAYALPVATGVVLSTFFWTEAGNFGWWRSIATVANADDLNELSSRRLDIWRACVDFIAERPLLGWGPDGYRFLLPKMDGQQPHNLAVQALVSCGAAGLLWGTLAACWLLVPGRGARRYPAGQTGALAMLVATLTGGLFDGTLYHVLSTAGLALAVGLVVSAKVADHSRPYVTTTRSIVLPHVLGTGILAMFALHFYVFYRLGPLREIPRPNDISARIVRIFPSTTIGLDRWLDNWSIAQPEAALDWARWAQSHSAYAWNYHAWAARHLAGQGRLEEARMEARLFLETQPKAFRERLAQPVAATEVRSSPPESHQRSAPPSHASSR